MSQHVIELNVISIVIGVLIARLIWVWIKNIEHYVQSKIDIDPDDSDDDRKDAIEMIPGTLTMTGIVFLIVIMIISGYLDDS